MVQHLRDYGTFKSQTHDRGRDRIVIILQAEESILERVEEEPNISTHRLVISQFVVYFELLNNVLEEQLDAEVPVGQRVRMWYFHDGAPLHFTTSN